MRQVIRRELLAFLHGFTLPFALIRATLRDRALRGPYLRVLAVRVLVVAAVAALGLATGKPTKRDRSAEHGHSFRLELDEGDAGEPVKVDMPGVHVDLDPAHGKKEVVVLGQHVAIDDHAQEKLPEKHARKNEPPPGKILGAWVWLGALVGFVSAIEGFVVALSRRWDDHISFHASRLAQIRPEDPAPKTPKIALDLKWLYKKFRRRIRGYVVFAAGMPLLALPKLIPVVGDWIFTAALTLWGWYWLGVFTAAKSAHAWIDEGVAPPPYVIRTFNARVSRGWYCAPLRWYGRLWAWLTRGVNPAAMTFDRSPAAFLGLALARVVLAAPVLYLMARPIVPVAAGRICAEHDPHDRVFLASAPNATSPAVETAAASV
jgi:hypothetical protein